MSGRLVKLFIAYLLLLALLAAEFFASSLHLDRSARVALLLPAMVMVGIVATIFMELRREDAPTLLFAVAAVLWLAILLGLGLMDPVTRVMYPAPQSAASAGLKAPTGGQ